jgi:hypothetical protein
MSKCNYRATINKIQTISCDYHLIANESGEKIVWYVDEALEHNFQSPYELNYIVDTADPICDISEKSKYHAVIKPLSEVINNTAADDGIFSATFSKSTYRAEIKCSSLDLQSVHKFFAAGVLFVRVDSGSLAIEVTNQSDFKVGTFIVIDPDTSIAEYKTIAGIGSLILDSPLRYSHEAGAAVKQIRALPPITPSPTASSTPQPTVTPSVTNSITPTITISPSSTVTPTSSITPTNSITVTPSVTNSTTPSATVTPTSSITPTNSITVTPSVTNSTTPSATVTPTSSITPSTTTTPDITITPTSSITPTNSITVTPSVTNSTTPSATVTPTSSITPSVTVSSTLSVTPTQTITPSISSQNNCDTLPAILPMTLCEDDPNAITPTPTNTPTPTVTPSISPTVSHTSTITPTNTISPTNTVTPSITPTVTPSITNSVTPTATITPSTSEFGSILGTTFKSTSSQFEFTINNSTSNAQFDDVKYKNILVDAINKWDAVIVSGPISSWKMSIAIDFDTLPSNVLAGAAIRSIIGNLNFGTFFPVSGDIVFNTLHLENMSNNVGNLGQNELYYTCLHEIGHLLGIGNFILSENDTLNGEPVVAYQESGVEKYYYTGQHAFQAYKDYLSPLGYDVSQLSGIPVEDNGGDGTANSHPEEGDVHFHSNNNRTIGGVFHPGLEHELMAGWSEGGDHTPLSKVTIGFLHDMGFNVDYNEAEPYNPEDPLFGTSPTPTPTPSLTPTPV